MEAFKLTLTVKGIQLDPLYFQEQETADAVVEFFNGITTVKCEFKGEKIQIMNHKEAFTDLMDVVNKVG